LFHVFCVSPTLPHEFAEGVICIVNFTPNTSIELKKEEKGTMWREMGDERAFPA
jgi:hypothetical protein